MALYLIGTTSPLQKQARLLSGSFFSWNTKPLWQVITWPRKPTISRLAGMTWRGVTRWKTWEKFTELKKTCRTVKVISINNNSRGAGREVAKTCWNKKIFFWCEKWFSYIKLLLFKSSNPTYYFEIYVGGEVNLSLYNRSIFVYPSGQDKFK